MNSSWLHEKHNVILLSEELNSAIDYSYEIWGENTFRKWKDGEYQGRFNRAIFDIMVYYFSDPQLRIEAKNHHPAIITKFKELSEGDIEFLNSFETSTKNIQPTAKRYTSWGEALKNITGYPVAIPNIN